MAADGSVVIETRMNTARAEKDLAKLKSKIQQSEDELDDTRQKRDEAQQKSVFDKKALDEEAAKLKDMKRDLQEMKAVASDMTYSSGARAEAKAQIPIAKEEIAEQQKRVSLLQAEWNKTQRAVEKYDRKIEDATGKIERQKEEAGKLESRLDEARTPVGKMSKAFDGSSESLDKLGKRISGLAKRVFIFTLITQALRTFRTYLSKVLKTNDEAQAAFARLKGALLTLAQPIIELLIPALTTLANILTVIVSAIASLVSSLFGKTAKQSAEAAKGLYDETQALEGVGSAAEEATGSLAGFDEINTIQTENSKGGGGAADVVMPDFTLDSNISDRLKEIADLVMLIAAGLALWKLGTRLPGVLGDISTVLGGILLTVGGLLLAWHGLSDAWENGVNWGNLIESIAGVATAALGLYLIFGKIGAGIGLIVGGIDLLVTAFHDAMEAGWSLQNTLMAIAGLLAAGLGIALLTGSWIPLLIAGIASVLLALTNATGHGEELIEGISQVIEGFKNFFVGIFTGDIKKAIDGIEKIIDGLKKAVFAVIDGVKDSFNNFLTWLDEKTGGKLHGIIEVVRGLFNGLFGFVKGTFGGLLDSLKQILGGVVKFISGVFTNDWDKAWNGVKDIFKGVFNGVVSILEGSVNLIIKGINWLIKQLNKISFEVPSWVPGIGGKTIGINIPPVGEVHIPRLAQGAVIPPNREFMAVLGDQKSGNNIEAPEELIRRIVREESGGNADILRQILQAIKEGKVMVVDRQVLARVTVRGINDLTIQAGKSVLKV